MSVLVSSQDIYVSTQQSGSASAQGSDDGFNRFRIAMNSETSSMLMNGITKCGLIASSVG